MTPPDAVARMAASTLLASFNGPDVPDWVQRRTEEGMGGVCLFGSNLQGALPGVEAAARVCALLHGIRPSLLIALDEEGGDVTRLEARTGSSVPGNAALGAIDDVALTRDVASAMGAVLSTVGIDLVLAPCSDVNVDAANPVIGVRSFGSDAELVARHVAAAVQGLQDAGVAACAKHFPGHGATTVDSHLELPVVDASADTVRRRELVPFRAAIAAGVATVMVGHLRLPAFDTEPATVSRRTLVDLLRDELGFTGAVVTDALDMHGIGGPEAIPATVVKALAAGADLCCLGPDATDELVGACIDAVVGAVRAGALDEQRLVEAAGHVANIVPVPLPPSPAERIELKELADIGLTAARRALRVEGVLPPRLDGPHVVAVRRPPNIAAGHVPVSLGEPLQNLDPNSSSEWLDPAATDQVPGVLARAEGRPLVIVVRDPQVLPGAPEVVGELLAARPDAVVVDMGWPAGDERRSRARIATFGASRVSIDTVAALLAGVGSTERTARG
jgi:beta-N-acetylhexosaminidase